MKYKGKNIIFDQDITITNTNHIGENLSQVINKLDQDVNNLKSNVNWIYKYGGVGSGTGGGSGTAPSPWNFRVELDDVVQEHNSTVNLGKQKEYKLSIRLFKVQGRTFTIKCTHTTNSGVRIIERTISPNQNPLFEEFIDLQVNGTLTVAINDDEGNFDQFIMNYIVTAYDFKLQYVNNSHEIYTPQNNNIFVNEIKEYGLLVDLQYTISVEITESSYIKYINWNNEVFEIPIQKGIGHLYLDLGKEITNENSGNYTFQVEVYLTLDGKVEEEEILPLKLQDNLIPSTIYLKVETDGVVYSDESNKTPYQFYAGAIPFRVTPFQGYPDANSYYSIAAYLNDELLSLNYTQLTDQKTHTLNIVTDKLGWNKVTFEIFRKGALFTKTYYFNVKSPLGSFTWYPTYEIDNIASIAKPKYSYQYKYSGNIYDGTIQIPKTNRNTLISKTLQNEASLYECSFTEDTGAMDCLISIGIEYSYLNDITNSIIKLSGKDSNNDIIIYQNKVTILGSDLEIYIPKQGYHLLSIYRRTVSTFNAAPLFEYNIYIDGCLEASRGDFNAQQESYNKIYLNKAIYNINYLELSYFEHNTIEHSEPFYKYNLNPQKTALKYLDDSGILFHYYSYKLTFEPESIPEEFQEVYAFVSQFYNDPLKNRIIVNETLIRSIAEKVKVPVLVLEYTQNRTTDPNWTSDGEDLFKWLENRYDVTSNQEILNQANPVKVFWSKGQQSLSEITTDANTQFQMSLQGTSTMLYGSKNLDLAVVSNDEEHTYLYSPNFNPEDNTTFLPETRFTLKADVVDSSHSNNNSLGKFVNTVSTKFAGAKQYNNKYSEFIKNTIQGFPVLLFLNNKYYINSTKETAESDFYFLGIYNFNLGRESEYNLGYKDLRLLPESITPGFAITKIKNDIKVGNVTLNSKSYINGFGVAEIRENRNYFDFSQSDRSILFPVSNTDNDYMFGKMKTNSQTVLESTLINLVDGVRKAGGYIFDQLGKNMLPDGGYIEGYKSQIPKNLVPNYKIKMKRNFVNAESVLIPQEGEIKGTANDLSLTLQGLIEDGVYPLIDYKSLSEYYVICMAFGLVDSVMKNLNLKTWNNNTFYTAFYDIDTGLKKDNAGNNTDYKAFSDYWKADSEVIGGSVLLRPAISYKDWYDKDVHGFDVPMTYLFALVKYAYQYIDKDTTISDWYPNNVWARMRYSSNSIPMWNKPEDTTHIGVLTNADKFINNFYKNHLQNIPDVFFNLNYRKKYFILNTESKDAYITEDYKKFSGRRIYSVRDWLHSRFHLLDLYFNIANVPDSIQKYNMTTGQWEFLNNNDYAKTSETFIDNNNPDIVVLRDIFSSSSADTKYSTNVDIAITAEENSPVCLSGAVTGRYIIENSQDLYSLKIESAGKGLNLGGSSNWITVNSINTLIQGGQFWVNSDKLTTLNGSSGECNSWSINLPALKSINLTSPQYSGNLQFIYDENGNRWANLNNINISGSRLGLVLNNINVLSVNADNVKYGNTLSISNCKYLQTLSLKNSIFTTINLSPKEKICFFSDYEYQQQQDGSWKITNTKANSPKCKYLSLTSNNGIIFIGDQQYLKGDSYEGLEEITLEGFKEIYIDNCNYLRKIQINDPENVTKFTVTNCSSQSTGLSINSDSAQVINLNKFTKLSEIYFYNTKKFTHVTTPNGVALKENAFFETNIKYLEGNNIKLSTGAFNRSNSFTLTQNESGKLCSFNNSVLYNNSTSLASTFYGCSITKDTFDLFNNTYKNLLNTITITNSMWGNNSKLSYSIEDLQQDYTFGECRYDLSMYTNVQSAQGMFGYCQIYTCHPDMFNNFGKNATTINISNIFGWGDKKEASIPIDWLKHIGNKVVDINTGTTSSTRNIIYTVLQSGNTQQLMTFKIHELFRGDATGSIGCSNITSLYNWNFKEDHTIDLKDSLSKFGKLNTIQYSFCGCKCLNFYYNDKSFLYDSTQKITNICGSFGFTNFSEIETVELEKFIDWENLPSKTKIFQYAISWDESKDVFGFKKSLNSIASFVYIFNILINKYGGTSLAHVFKKCTLKILDTESNKINFDLGTKTNTTITDLPYLFSSFKTEKEEAIDWDWDMFKALPNIKNLKHCFEYMNFKNSVPFNAFKKRKRNTIQNKYVKINNDFIQGKLITYSYNLHITDMSYCFYQCVFEEPTFNFNKIYDKDNINSPGVIYIESNNGIEYFEEYYDNTSVLSALKKIDNTEFDDLNKQVVYSSVIYNTDDMQILHEISNGDVKPYTNFELYESTDIDHPFIATDIFYGCTTSADLTSCFEGCTLQGFIPDNLFKNCKTAIIKNFIKDVIILPKKLKTAYSSDLLQKYNLSYYIGSNFIKSTNLDYAFNFKMCLPGGIYDWDPINKNGGSVKSKERDLFIFCMIDSFNSNLDSASNMYPSVINDPPENHVFVLQNEYNDILLSTMYNQNNEQIIEIEVEGLPTQLTLLGSFGFDISKKYIKLTCDNLINGLFMQFNFDKIFDKYTTLDSIKQKSRGNWVMYFGNSNNTYGVSNNAILPYAKSNKLKYLYVHYLSWGKQTDGTWSESINGYSIQIKKNQVINYQDGVTNINYNNSRVDTTGWSLTFK